MAYPRFFCTYSGDLEDLSIGAHASFELNADDLHHAARVMRIAPGERMELVIRDTWDHYLVEVEGFSGTAVETSVMENLELSSDPFDITLFFGLSKGSKNDVIVRQATEIGASQLCPVLFERTVIRLDEKKAVARRQRLENIAESAARQAHRCSIPVLHAPTELGNYEELLQSMDALYVLWEEAPSATFTECLKATLAPDASHIGIIIGPEGGLSGQEVAWLEERGALRASLGSAILRVDTANTVALGILIDFMRARALERGEVRAEKKNSDERF